ncbi:hypothetical protein CRG98_005313 [Punica granatum]|uniref:Uncharacterized protein n=1 Tax=Punica granatum TaxID=22663 RepID=A0A2I0L0M9_PUNGR|nr:hypothetical protein CRG98_005313 [Punica granatum]
MGCANETRTRTGGPFLLVDRGVSNSLTPRVSVNHGMTVMPLDNKIVVFMCKLRITSHEEVQGGLACLDSSRLKSGPDSSHSAQDRPPKDGETDRDSKEVTDNSATSHGLRNNIRESHGIKDRGALRLRIGQGASRPLLQGSGRGFLDMAEPSKGSPS